MSRTKAENKAIREKVQQLIQEGWPAKQSQAIAFRMFRANELSTSIADVPRLSRKENNQRKALNKNRIKGTKAIQKAHEAYDRDKSTEIKNVQISENLSITKDPEAGWTGTRKYINPETLEESTETLPYRNLTKKEKDTAASKRTEQRNKQFMDTDIYKEHHAKYASKGSVYNPASRKIEYRAHSKE